MTLLDLTNAIAVLPDDFCGEQFYTAVITRSLNVRADMSLQSRVVDVLHNGDCVIVHMAAPGTSWARLRAVNWRYTEGMGYGKWWVLADYLSELTPRPYVSPDPTAVG